MKRVLYWFFALSLILAVVVSVGSIDAVDYDDQGLLDNSIDVPDHQNGFKAVAYMADDSFNLDLSADEGKQLKSHLLNSEWNSEFVARVLAENVKHIDSVMAAVQYDLFKFPEVKGVAYIANYSPLLAANRLVILKSMYAAKAGRLDTAIRLAEVATIFSQQVKTESNNLLISHMIGLAMQYEALVWVHHLAVDYALNEKQYVDLIKVFESIPSYKEDGFTEVFSSEHAFVKTYVDEMLEMPLRQRWDDYWDSYAWRVSNNIEEEGFKGKVYNFLNIIFPHYYIHGNSMLNEVAPMYAYSAEQAKSYCNEIIANSKNSKTTHQTYKVTWGDLVMPGSASKLMAGMNVISAEAFDGYYQRRCFGHAHIEGVKSIVALKAYALNAGTLPNAMMDLVPDYLSVLPLDPFNGESLKYSKESAWVYSVGSNAEDSGGSQESYYIRCCQRNEICSKNPTFPIILHYVGNQRVRLLDFIRLP